MPLYLTIIVTRLHILWFIVPSVGIGVAKIFRGWVRPAVDPGFLVGGDGGAEGPERGAVGANRRSAEGIGSGEGHRSHSSI